MSSRQPCSMSMSHSPIQQMPKRIERIDYHRLLFLNSRETLSLVVLVQAINNGRGCGESGGQVLWDRIDT